MHLLIVVAHPDDEIINAGGTIVKHLKRSDKVSVIFMTYGEKGWPAPMLGSAQVRNIRLREAKNVCKQIGTSICFMELSDTCVLYDIHLRSKLIKTIRTLKPDILITHFFGERNPDHRNVSILTLDASYLAGIAGECPEIIPHQINSEYMFASQDEYNLLSSYPFKIHVDVSNVFEEAITALKGYKSQYRYYETIMRKNVTTLGVNLGVRFAEAFIPVRMNPNLFKGYKILNFLL